MADTKYLDALLDAIKRTYDESIQSKNYFGITNGRERSMVFRIAHHLARDIENKEVFVDTEPTRCEGRVKRKPQTKRNNEGKPIIPDLIIHKRIDTGYVAVEFKCSTSNWYRDYKKLKYLTSKDSKPHYELGVFVYLANNMQDIEIKIFKDGLENTEMTNLYQNKFRR